MPRPVAQSAPTTIPDPTTTTAPTTTTVSMDAADAALLQIEPGLGSQYATSGAVAGAQGFVAAVSYDVGAMGRINVYRFTGSTWATVATLGAADDLDAMTPGAPITAVHLTHGADPDFYVRLSGADHTGAVVVSDFSGPWHLVSVDHGSSGPELIDSTLTPDGVTESRNDCNPDCADGTSTTTSYTFNATSGIFVPGTVPTPVTPPTTPAISFGELVSTIQIDLQAGTLPGAAAVPDAYPVVPGNDGSGDWKCLCLQRQQLVDRGRRASGHD